MKVQLGLIKTKVWEFAKQRPKVAAGIAVIIVLLFGLILRGCSKGGTTTVTYHTVKRGDFLISIVEGGTLKAVNEVNVRSELEGTTRIISIVPEGTFVKKGDQLVELDSADLRDRLTAQEVIFQNAQFASVQAKEALSIQKSLVESNIKDSELKVEFAKSDLEKYKEGDWPQTKKNKETAITIAAEELERAKDRLNWTQELNKKGYATKSELDADTLTVKRKGIELAQAEEDLRLLTKYDYPKRTRLLEANVEQAEKELERLKLRSAAQIAQAEADLSSKNNTLELQESRLKLLKEQLEFTKISAPQDGMVIYASSGSRSSSSILIEEGATVRQRQDIILLPDISQMMVEIRVHESHVQKIKPGQGAYITIDSLPDQQFKGRVRKVAILPDATSRYYNPNLKVYLTEVVIEDAIPDLKPGISGRAEVIITNLHNVISVPIQAVTSVKGKQVCFVQNGSSRTKVPVEIGMYNDKYIEIKSGLKEGDMVLLSAQSEGDSIDLSGSIADSDEADAAVKAAARKSEEERKHPEEKQKKKLPPLVPKNPDGKPSKGGKPPKPPKF